MLRTFIIYSIFISFSSFGYATSYPLGIETNGTQIVQYKLSEGFTPKKGVVLAQTMFPTNRNSCPSGSRHAGRGYCRIR